MIKAKNMLVKIFYITPLLIASASCTSLKDHLPANYSAEDVPEGENGEPLKIKLTLWLESIGDISVNKMEMQAYGHIIQTWTDPQLKRKPGPMIISKDKSLIWTPDVFCSNCRSSSIGGENIIQIDSTGRVSFTQKAELSSTCFMNLRKFPFDDQMCNITFASYGYNKSYVTYKWEKPPVLEFRKLSQFDVKDISIIEEETDYKSGTFSMVKSSFYLRRRTVYYLLQGFLPTAMLVCLSWIVLFMHPNDVANRLTIAITFLLTMVFFTGYINSGLPKLSYIKAIDVYLFCSLLFVCLTILEAIIVCALYKIHKKKLEKLDKKESENAEENQDLEAVEELELLTVKCNGEDKESKEIDDETAGILEKARKRARKAAKRMRRRAAWARCQRKLSMHRFIEFIARIAFPGTYAVFNLAYYNAYLSGRGDPENLR